MDFPSQLNLFQKTAYHFNITAMVSAARAHSYAVEENRNVDSSLWKENLHKIKQKNVFD